MIIVQFFVRTYADFKQYLNEIQQKNKIFNETLNFAGECVNFSSRIDFNSFVAVNFSAKKCAYLAGFRTGARTYEP